MGCIFITRSFYFLQILQQPLILKPIFEIHTYFEQPFWIEVFKKISAPIGFLCLTFKMRYQQGYISYYTQQPLLGGGRQNNQQCQKYLRLRHIPKRALQLLVIKKIRWEVIVMGSHVYKIDFLTGGYLKMKKIFCEMVIHNLRMM